MDFCYSGWFKFKFDFEEFYPFKYVLMNDISYGEG